MAFGVIGGSNALDANYATVPWDVTPGTIIGTQDPVISFLSSGLKVSAQVPYTGTLRMRTWHRNLLPYSGNMGITTILNEQGIDIKHHEDELYTHGDAGMVPQPTVFFGGGTSVCSTRQGHTHAYISCGAPAQLGSDILNGYQLSGGYNTYDMPSKALCIVPFVEIHANGADAIVDVEGVSNVALQPTTLTLYSGAAHPEVAFQPEASMYKYCYALGSGNNFSDAVKDGILQLNHGLPRSSMAPRVDAGTTPTEGVGKTQTPEEHFHSTLTNDPHLNRPRPLASGQKRRQKHRPQKQRNSQR